VPHCARVGGTQHGSRAGPTLSSSPEESAGASRPGISALQSGSLCPRVLLAPARGLQELYVAENAAGILATEVQAERFARSAEREITHATWLEG
jgi:hypothetical protein